MRSRVTREQFAWAAGLFEGEGCFYGDKGKQPAATLVSTDLDRIQLFAQIVGIGNVVPRKKLEGRKQAYHWQVNSFEKVQHVAAVLWEWLGPRRKAKAVEVLRVHRGRPPKNGIKTHCKRGHSYSAENTYGFDGRRYCRMCNSINSKTYYHKKQKYNLKEVERVPS